MKNLENLEQFTELRAEETSVIAGGAAASKKKDVTSDSADSYKRDKVK